VKGSLKAILTILRETTTCLNILQLMSRKWPTARRCYDVLSILLEDLRVQYGEHDKPLQQLKNNIRHKSSRVRDINQTEPINTISLKRQKLNSPGSMNRKQPEASQQVLPSQQHRIDACNVTSSEPTLPEGGQGN
jgi:hypothetical protein